MSPQPSSPHQNVPDTLHLVCPHCQGVNRVPRARLTQAPQCGRCHRALFAGSPTAVDGGTLTRHLERDELPVLVDFWAPWCGPCKMMAPAFAEAARLLEPRVRLLKLDTEAHGEAGARFGIRSIPTLILFQGGREVARQSGALATRDILAWLQAQGLPV